MIRPNRSLRMSLPTRWAAVLANTPHKMPVVPPKTISSTIRIPMERMTGRLPPSTPSSTITAIMAGCSISMAISPSMNSGASTQQYQ